MAFSFDTTTELPIQSMDCNGSFSTPIFILAVLLCIKTANILIKLVLKKYQKCRSVDWKSGAHSHNHSLLKMKSWSQYFHGKTNESAVDTFLTQYQLNCAMVRFRVMLPMMRPCRTCQTRFKGKRHTLILKNDYLQRYPWLARALSPLKASPPAQHTAQVSHCQERPPGPSLSPILPIQSSRHSHVAF